MYTTYPFPKRQMYTGYKSQTSHALMSDYVTFMCCLIYPGPPGYDQDGMATGFACEGSDLEIHCSNGTTISIIHANYGRLDENICNDDVVPVDIIQRRERRCISNQTLDIVRQRFLWYLALLNSVLQSIFKLSENRSSIIQSRETRQKWIH